MSGQWPKIRDAVVGLVDERLEGAACVGRAPLFDTDPAVDEDDDATAYRLNAAARICRSCPVLSACDAVADEQGRGVLGVWAGRARGTPRRPDRSAEVGG
ncbi:WhiB family transcriptional regulator [Nocardia rhizosphaerihabitans]|uniref:WhiB family transcriptional regulator n=1 Tax=Nocardia rhizosphaerihabitans TaxID=1691570 RepID=UPI00366B2E02